MPIKWHEALAECHFAFGAQKNQGPLENARFSARTHFETYNRPHFVICGRVNFTKQARFTSDEHWSFTATCSNNFRHFLLVVWYGLVPFQSMRSIVNSQRAASIHSGALWIYNAPQFTMLCIDWNGRSCCESIEFCYSCINTRALSPSVPQLVLFMYCTTRLYVSTWGQQS